MLEVTIKSRDNVVKCPKTNITLFEIKNAYICTGQLAPELTEDLFALTDFLIDRLLQTESERFRNDY